MNLAKCPNGHFYDKGSFAECPYCMQREQQQTEPLKDQNPFSSPAIAMPQKTVKQSVPLVEEQLADEEKSIDMYQKIPGVEPVVGWLVCIKGEYFGESFELHSGKNFIGRVSDMDIILGLDKSVSRNRHACVFYESRSRAFFAQPGESKEEFYLNDEVVLENVKMKAYDVLKIGETKLMMIPCCGEKFGWDKLREK